MTQNTDMEKVFESAMALGPRDAFRGFFQENTGGDTIIFKSRLDELTTPRLWSLMKRGKAYWPEINQRKIFKLKPGEYVELPHCFYTMHPETEGGKIEVRTRGESDL